MPKFEVSVIKKDLNSKSPKVPCGVIVRLMRIWNKELGENKFNEKLRLSSIMHWRPGGRFRWQAALGIKQPVHEVLTSETAYIPRNVIDKSKEFGRF